MTLSTIAELWKLFLSVWQFITTAIRPKTKKNPKIRFKKQKRIFLWGFLKVDTEEIEIFDSSEN